MRGEQLDQDRRRARCRIRSPRTPTANAYSALKSGEADVIYTDYALLLGYEYEDPNSLKLIDTHAGTQYYGIGLPLGDSLLQSTIDNLLSQAINDGTWRAIFNSTLAPEGLKANPPKVRDWPSS